MAASSGSAAGVPPGFRFHPTDEELLLYYLKKKIALEKFELEVIREIDLNKIEPWELQERCRIGSTPQNEWYFFSHKDRKYPTGSRTNRATAAGFWKATGRDKCIRSSYSKIGMRKTLVFYRGRAPHGQKTDWIMHEYRLEDPDDDVAAATEDGWVVCRVFKKKCFFKVGSSRGEGSTAVESHMNAAAGHEQTRALVSSHFMARSNMSHRHYHHHHHHPTPNLYYYSGQYVQASSYSHAQLQDLLTNHRSSTSGYDFPCDSAKLYDGGGMEAGAGSGCEGMRRETSPNEWTVLDGLGGASGAAQMNEMANQRGGEMDLWGYGK
ncbi:hypothetical protein Cni_G12839 [Canna indica]|uniref:NAC domain-containing protein n=1 Tax=Canna indica TaxID=4628 RepID=A0AAQ3KBF9_9LILI|nr:hypothetical protein Cni_G12839 [Canna indica]